MNIKKVTLPSDSVFWNDNIDEEEFPLVDGYDSLKLWISNGEYLFDRDVHRVFFWSNEKVEDANIKEQTIFKLFKL